MKKSFYDFTITELKDYMLENKFKSYSGDQVFKWIYEQRVFDFTKMTNISKDLQTFFAENMDLSDLEIESKHISTDGTIKYLLKLADGNSIETVLMTHDYGKSVCVTSQVGCSMGCAFCASGLIKKQRNLEVHELVRQITTVQNDLDLRISHVVVMGTGEPFDNYDNVMKFIRVINYKHGLQIGSRHITVSTCGIVPKIYEYAKEQIKCNLAISLHASNDQLRSELMPINRRYPISDVINACKDYFKMTGRRVTFEYILLEGINDDLKYADELSDLIRGMNAYVNLIPYNVVDEFKFKKTNQDKASKFYIRLTKRGINATMRREQGSDIDAACGQLRLKKEKLS